MIFKFDRFIAKTGLAAQNNEFNNILYFANIPVIKWVMCSNLPPNNNKCHTEELIVILGDAPMETDHFLSISRAAADTSPAFYTVWSHVNVYALVCVLVMWLGWGNFTCCMWWIEIGGHGKYLLKDQYWLSLLLSGVAKCSWSEVAVANPCPFVTMVMITSHTHITHITIFTLITSQLSANFPGDTWCLLHEYHQPVIFDVCQV